MRAHVHARADMLRPSPCTSRLDALLSGSGRRWEQTVLFFPTLCSCLGLCTLGSHVTPPHYCAVKPNQACARACPCTVWASVVLLFFFLFNNTCESVYMLRLCYGSMPASLCVHVETQRWRAKEEAAQWVMGPGFLRGRIMDCSRASEEQWKQSEFTQNAEEAGILVFWGRG